MPRTISKIPKIPKRPGMESLKIKILPSSVNITSPDCVASMMASLCGLLLTRSVALKNSNVAGTPENIATAKD